MPKIPANPIAAILFALPVAASAADYGTGYQEPYEQPPYEEQQAAQPAYPPAGAYEPVYAPPGAVFVAPPPVYWAPPVYVARPVVMPPIMRPYPVPGAYAAPIYVGRPYGYYGPRRRW